WGSRAGSYGGVSQSPGPGGWKSIAGLPAPDWSMMIRGGSQPVRNEPVSVARPFELRISTVLLPELFHAEKPPASILMRSDEPDHTRRPDGSRDVWFACEEPITSMTEASSKKTAPCESWLPTNRRTAYEIASDGRSTTSSIFWKVPVSWLSPSEMYDVELSARVARTEM